MSDPFEDFYDEIENLGSAVSKFIHPRDFGERWDGTWAYFSFSYERAFEQLARKAYEDGTRGMHLIEPLFLLARHSIELALKATISDFATTDTVAPQLLGHRLLDLWDQLYAFMERYGSPPNDKWGIKCRELVAHIHEADPEGDRYRYPSNRKGIEFAGTSIDVAGLIRAHGHVTTYLDALPLNAFGRVSLRGMGSLLLRIFKDGFVELFILGIVAARLYSAFDR